jgi:hypothetical protein
MSLRDLEGGRIGGTSEGKMKGGVVRKEGKSRARAPRILEPSEPLQGKELPVTLPYPPWTYLQELPKLHSEAQIPI